MDLTELTEIEEAKRELRVSLENLDDLMAVVNNVDKLSLSVEEFDTVSNNPYVQHALCASMENLMDTDKISIKDVLSFVWKAIGLVIDKIIDWIKTIYRKIVSYAKRSKLSIKSTLKKYKNVKVDSKNDFEDTVNKEINELSTLTESVPNLKNFKEEGCVLISKVTLDKLMSIHRTHTTTSMEDIAEINNVYNSTIKNKVALDGRSEIVQMDEVSFRSLVNESALIRIPALKKIARLGADIKTKEHDTIGHRDIIGTIDYQYSIAGNLPKTFKLFSALSHKVNDAVSEILDEIPSDKSGLETFMWEDKFMSKTKPAIKNFVDGFNTLATSVIKGEFINPGVKVSFISLNFEETFNPDYSTPAIRPVEEEYIEKAVDVNNLHTHSKVTNADIVAISDSTIRLSDRVTALDKMGYDLEKLNKHVKKGISYHGKSEIDDTVLKRRLLQPLSKLAYVDIIAPALKEISSVFLNLAPEASLSISNKLINATYVICNNGK